MNSKGQCNTMLQIVVRLFGKEAIATEVCSTEVLNGHRRVILFLLFAIVVFLQAGVMFASLAFVTWLFGGTLF